MTAIRDRHNNWFKPYFDKLNQQKKPIGPPGLTRQNSTENSALVITNPYEIDLHVSHSLGLEHGPIIERTGDSAPFMEDPEQPGTYTTDTELQRIGSYYILESTLTSHIQEIFFRLAGSYIIYSCIVGEIIAKNLANRLLVTYFPGATSFPMPATFNSIRLDTDMMEFRDSVKSYLDASDSNLGRVFEACVKSATTGEAVKAMDSLYKKTIPSYIDEFGTLKSQDAYKKTIRYNTEKYLRLLLLTLKTTSHEGEAKKRAPDKTIVLMQGCGDLTMNQWNIAFLSGQSYSDLQGWDLLHPPEEPINDRCYTALIKWSCPEDDEDLKGVAAKTRVVYPYQIATVQFKAPSLQSTSPNRHVFLDNNPIGHLIEFAVYGQQMIKDGKNTPLECIMTEFADIRHIFKLPNLNRAPKLNPDDDDEEDYTSETFSAGITEYALPPRNLFNQSTHDSVWLGEAALIQGDRNLKVAALYQPIQIDLRSLGAPREWIEIVLTKEHDKYHTYCKVDHRPTRKGEWRWLDEGRRTWLEIFLLPNQYPCTMIGVCAEDEGTDPQKSTGDIVHCKDLLFLAHGHNYDWTGCTVEECATYLINTHHCANALMFDEGNDVFQLVRDQTTGQLMPSVPLKRKELRCAFWATEK